MQVREPFDYTRAAAALLAALVVVGGLKVVDGCRRLGRALHKERGQ